MAFLNNLTLRPSCVFSDLPSQFLDPLVRDLDSVIAATTCDLEELHRTVKLRSASLVVVGASSKSYAIAEQLSHDELSVKVFLVRFNDDFPEPGYKNGFAGIADLRTGSAQFAETLKRAVGLAASAEEFVPSMAPGLSYEEITGHRSAEHDDGDDLSTVLLERFLQIAGTSRGLFLLPRAGNSTFKVMSQMGFAEELPANITFAPGVLRALQQGRIVESTKGRGLELGWEKAMRHPFTMAVPLVDQAGLCGCLLGSQNGNLNEIIAFSSHASRLLAKAGLEEGIETIRAAVSIAQKQETPCWMLVSDSGEISWQEGNRENLPFQAGDIIRAPRLRDVINRSFQGESGTVRFKGHSFAYGKMERLHASRALLVLSATSEAEDQAPALNLPPEVMLRILQQELPPLSGGGSSPGIPELEKINSELSPSVQIMLRVLEKCLEKKLIYKISASSETVTILFEVEESLLEQPLMEEITALPMNWIIQLALKIISPKLTQPEWSSGTFGGKIEFTVSSALLRL